MKSVVFLANAGSPHVRHWSSCLRRAGVEHRVETIHENTLLADVEVKRHFLWLERLGRIGELLGYFLLGFRLRILSMVGNDLLIHAHNTSGYGLAAWLSGHPYVVTTYGSEIYTAPTRGWLYRWLIQKVLSGALRVTASTASMSAFLRAHFKLSANRIDAFTLGVTPIFFYDPLARVERRQVLGISAQELVWFYNRRMTPLYNTLQVVIAFRRYFEKTGSGRLLLLEGDSDQEYLNAVLLAAKGCSAIKCLRGFISQEELRGWLSMADFSISVPNSDQLSSSILEGIACGCLPILLDNPAYAQLMDEPCSIVLKEPTEDLLLKVFNEGESWRGWLSEEARSTRLTILLGEEFGAERVSAHINHLYLTAEQQRISGIKRL